MTNFNQVGATRRQPCEPGLNGPEPYLEQESLSHLLSQGFIAQVTSARSSKKATSQPLALEETDLCDSLEFDILGLK